MTFTSVLIYLGYSIIFVWEKSKKSFFEIALESGLTDAVRKTILIHLR